jgi:hypothetical protein
MSETKQHPLVLVFYLDREMMQTPEILKPFAESINHMINYKNMNAIALFMLTDGEERVECLNPVVVPKAEMDKITKMIDEISKQFGVGDEIDNLPENPTEDGSSA